MKTTIQNSNTNKNELISTLQHQLELSNQRIEELTKNTNFNPIEEQEYSYHLAFMFASPLVRKIDKELENIMQLDYRNEIWGIEKTFKDIKYEVKYKTDVATTSNFRSMIADAPFALHFTGHGVQNNRQSLGSVYQLYRDKGDILLLEDDKLMAEYLFEDDLTKLLGVSKSSNEASIYNEVVFVSSCHSEFAGNIFYKAGAHHVICINTSDTVLDKASLRFSKVFYETVFMKKYSVCEAFNIAKEDIKSLFSSGEASKYILLVNNKCPVPGKKNRFEHKCYPISKLKPG